MDWTRRLKIVFYIEIVINLISIFSFMFSPEAMFQNLGITQASPPLMEMGRWFATLTFVITYIMVRTLLSRNELLLRFVLEGTLIGDFIYLVVAFKFVSVIGGTWAVGTIFGVGVTILLVIARVLYLFGTRRLTPSS
jgi:hypothetical protein